MLNNFVEKELLRTKSNQIKKKSIFFKRDDPCFWLKKVQFFSLFVFAQNKIRIKV